MNTKKIFVFTLVLITMLLSAACGGAAPTTAPQPEATQPPAPAGEPVTLVFWSMWNEPEPQAKVIAGWIKDFEAQNPNIKFEVVWNGRENQTKARTALASGTVIDLVDQDTDQIAGGMISEGLAYPLDEFLTQTALDENVPIKDVFTPGVLDTFMIEGKHYHWP